MLSYVLRTLPLAVFDRLYSDFYKNSWILVERGSIARKRGALPLDKRRPELAGEAGVRAGCTPLQLERARKDGEEAQAGGAQCMVGGVCEICR